MRLSRLFVLPVLSVLAVLPALSACTGAEARRLAQPVLDSLPGGIPRVTSPGPTSWEGASGWQLELVAETTGDPQTEGELIDPNSVALDEWGRAFVVDQKPATIKVFGQDGRFIRTIGREGGGPGEFRVGFIAVRGGHVVVHDPQATRTSVWDTAGTFLRSWSSSCCYWSDIQLDRAGRVYIPSTYSVPAGAERPNGTPYIRWSLEGTPVDTLWVPNPDTGAKFWTVTANRGGQNVMQMNMPVPLAPRLVSGFNPDGGFLVGWSGEYQLAVAPHGSDTSLVFRRTWTPEPVTAERREYEVSATIARLGEQFEETALRQSFNSSDIPATAPPFVALHVDADNNRWVRLDPGMDTTTTRFDVYNPAGEYLGLVAATANLPMYGRMVFGHGELVVTRENIDGIPVLARYRVVKGER